LGKFCLFFAKFRRIIAKYSQKLAKTGKIWANSSSQKIPGLMSYPTVEIFAFSEHFSPDNWSDIFLRIWLFSVPVESGTFSVFNLSTQDF